jgi:acyl dehydratase
MTPSQRNLAHAQVGDALPPIELPPVSRHSLALYCGASGDHNPIHVDSDFARNEAKVPDVFAHGMLSMAWLGRLLTQWVPQAQLREYSVRFAAITQVGERITCAGQVVEKFERDGQTCARLTLTTTNAEGQVKLAGEAVVALA